MNKLKVKDKPYNLFLLLLFISELGIFSEIFLFRKKSDLITFSLITIFVLGAIGLKLKSKIFFLNALLFLIIALILSIFQNDLTPEVTFVEKSALWFYIFLLIGVIKQTIELYRPSRLKK